MGQTLEKAAGAGEASWSVLWWAYFLGCSWTWVLGMVFPVLLVRDYGLWGWVAFVLPNAGGAAAMGFVLARPGASRRVVEEHGQACARFSEVTLAFHAFVVGWLLWLLLGPWGVMGVTAVVLAVLFAWGQKGRLLAVSGLVTAVSALMLAGWLIAGEAELPRITMAEGAGGDLLMLAPALAVGLVLCPYLDLTFHRARQHTPERAGKWAFALGFGVVFMVMMVFALLYAVALRGFFDDPWGVDWQGPILWVLGTHLVVQAGFTVALHLREVGARAGHQGLHRAFMFVIIGGALALWAATERGLHHEMVMGEVIYRGFLLLYGLVFPGYVWLCMIPTRRAVSRGSRLAVFVGAVIVCLPMGYWGLVAGVMWWVPVSLVVLGLARVAVEVQGKKQNGSWTDDG